MKQHRSFFTSVCALAVPVALQSLLQSSFSVVDQIMLGQLGEVCIAGVGFAGKFLSIFSVVVSAVGAVAGIMLSQYLGQRNGAEVRRSFSLNLTLSLMVALCFTSLCFLLPVPLMGLYTNEAATREIAANYLRIAAGSCLPMAVATLLSTLYRCNEKASYPLFASILSALLNTGLNYLLIFGKAGFPPMGAEGAALATLISQWVNLLLMLFPLSRLRDLRLSGRSVTVPFRWRQYAAMLLPLLACEFFWSLGENVYAVIYGRMGTDASAAMTLINPVQSLMIGALCGLSQAAGVIVGKRLGSHEFDTAYLESKKLISYGAAAATVLSLLIILTSPLYVRIYQVAPNVRVLARQILLAYALIAPFKVLNMILGSGILRSGGRTKYIMLIDMLGTWGFGVPLGLLAAFVWKLPIAWVYFLLSLEECVRFSLSLAVFRRKNWMHRLDAATQV